MAAYVPRKGDFVALDFDPQTGHEQQGRRPVHRVPDHQRAARLPLSHIDPGRMQGVRRRHGRADQVDRLPRPQGEAHRTRAGRSAAGSALAVGRLRLLRANRPNSGRAALRCHAGGLEGSSPSIRLARSRFARRRAARVLFPKERDGSTEGKPRDSWSGFARRTGPTTTTRRRREFLDL
jgi:hypothetical protein